MQDKLDFKHPDYEFDDIAQNIFYPIYAVIAGDLLAEIGVTSGRMLDIGCGGGHLGFAVMDQSDLGGTFVDINATAIQCAKERAVERGHAERSDFYVADVEQLPLSANSFDLIVCRGSMLFWEHQEKAVAELCRVLAPGGKTYIGGSLGRPHQREAIRAQMKQRGLACRGDRPELSKTLPDEEYIKMAPKFGCSCRVVEDEERGHWLVFEKITILSKILSGCEGKVII